MSHLEIEIKLLREELFAMWELVLSQLKRAGQSLGSFDKRLAGEVVSQERNVDRRELEIDRHCENIFALHCPVAVDLRFVLAVLKINYNLERIGDYAEGIARIIIASPAPFNEGMLRETRLAEMLTRATGMIEEARLALEEEKTAAARDVLAGDDLLDHIHNEAGMRLRPFTEGKTGFFDEALSVHSVIQKLERIGDQATNIAEEIIFYVEAKVLKHRGIQ
jgi:phosphate transport system protein